MYKPLVSIVIPVYNGSNYLAEAVESALEQTYDNIEIIIINDGSTDEGATEKLALSYGDKIRYINKKNGGSSSALNIGIENMKGEWFSWLSHDDLYHPEKIKAQIDLLNKLLSNKTVQELSNQIIICARKIIDGNGADIYKPKKKKLQQEFEIVNNYSNMEIAVELLHNITFYGCGFLLPRNCFLKIGKFDENLRLLNDVDYWIRLLKNEFEFHYIPRTLVSQRMHKAQISYQIGFSYNNREQDYFWKSIIEEIKTHTGEDRAECFFRVGRYALHKGRKEDANDSFQYCLKMDPKYKYKIIFERIYIAFYRTLRNFAKKIYLKIKM